MSVNSTIPAVGIRDDEGNRASLDKQGIRTTQITKDADVADLLRKILTALEGIHEAIQELDNT